MFYIIPTLIELYLVSQALFRRFGYLFTTIMLTTFACYFAYTISITQWRIALRTKLVSVDNKRNGFFIDSILNQETGGLPKTKKLILPISIHRPIVLIATFIDVIIFYKNPKSKN